MQRELIEQFVLNTLSEITLIKPESIHRKLHLEADLGLDSISMASLVAKFETIISNHPQMDQLLQSLLSAETVGELIDLLENSAGCPQ
jgi:acyl carrier protein